MSKDTVVQLRQPEGQDVLSTMLREGAQRLIAEALQAEFDEFLSQFAERRDDQGRAAVVRNGCQPRREVLTGLGPVGVRVPKARSRIEKPAVFRSALVPPYVRRAKAVGHQDYLGAGDPAEHRSHTLRRRSQRHRMYWSYLQSRSWFELPYAVSTRHPTV